jgi:hypothetical protein
MGSATPSGISGPIRENQGFYLNGKWQEVDKNGEFVRA